MLSKRRFIDLGFNEVKLTIQINNLNFEYFNDNKFNNKGYLANYDSNISFSIKDYLYLFNEMKIFNIKYVSFSICNCDEFLKIFPKLLTIVSEIKISYEDEDDNIKYYCLDISLKD